MYIAKKQRTIFDIVYVYSYSRLIYFHSEIHTDMLKCFGGKNVPVGSHIFFFGVTENKQNFVNY